jgi:hypothetical protein
VLGYQYFGGIKTWSPLNRPQVSDLSPIKTSTSKPSFALAADMVMKVNGSWGGIEPAPRTFVYSNMPQHRSGNGMQPDGGNQVFIDGSGRYIRFQSMFALHSWAWGGREAYFYQDPSTFPAGFNPEKAKF